MLRNGLVLTNPDPAASANNCATDADTDAAYALLLAGAAPAYRVRVVLGGWYKGTAHYRDTSQRAGY